jgi:hypothetical protein
MIRTAKTVIASKSPFAYTDSFQVTAFLEGRSRIYDIFFNAGQPETALLSDEPSDEPQGILVSFGVNPKDIQDFVRAIKRATEGLDVTPEFKGEIELHKREVKDEGDGWKLLDRTQSGKAEARQGTVLYPLNFQAVIDCPTELSALFDQPFRFDFPIGSLDIVTSREALSYDEETSKNIVERLKAVQADIMQRIADKIANSQTYWEFCANFKQITATYPEHKFGKLMAEKPTFRGRKPVEDISVKTNGVRIPAVMDKEKNVVIKPMEFKFRFGNLTYCKIHGGDFTNSISFREDKDKRSNLLTLNVTRKLIVVTEDMRAKNRYPAVRIRKLLDKLMRDDPLGYRSSTLLWIRHQGDSQYVFNRMFAAFGRPDMEVHNLLDIEHEIPPRQYASGPRMPFKRLTNNGTWVTPDADTPLPPEAYFVPMRNGDVDFADGPQFSPGFMADILPVLVAFGADDKPIIGIPASSRKIVTNNPQWTPFYAFVASVVEDMFDQEAYTRLRRSKTSLSKHSILEAISNLESHATNKSLFRDAFAGSSVEELRNLYDFTPGDDDGYQQTIVDIISRLEDRRVSLAEKANAEKRAEYEAMLLTDPNPAPVPFDELHTVENGGIESTENRAHKLRFDTDKAIVEWGAEAYAKCQAVADEFPLLGAVRFAYISNANQLADELLNYVFNKRLMASEAAANAVDIADAA